MSECYPEVLEKQWDWIQELWLHYEQDHLNTIQPQKHFTYNYIHFDAQPAHNI